MRLPTRLRPLLLSALCALLWLAPSLARAADDYVDVTPQNVTKSVSAPLFVIISYSAIWLVVVLLALALYKRQSALKEELARAEATLRQLKADDDD